MNEKHRWMNKNCPRYPMFINYLRYMDVLAREIGCMPQNSLFWLYKLRLQQQLLFGSIRSAQYRVSGPHRSDVAVKLLSKL